MALSIYKIKKWVRMLRGNSVFHVNQDEGKCYSKDEVCGYYNNLTEKITRFGLNDNSVPKSFVDTGKEIYFSISIFQYGLAAYDLYLMYKDDSYIEKLKVCANWAVENQQEDGSWETFSYKTPKNPQSSMAQGEGISMLIRAHIVTKDDRYVVAAQKAFKFMLIPLNQGGTTSYLNGDIWLFEHVGSPCILNGWIFSAWGIYDYAKYFKDSNAWKVWNQTVQSMVKSLKDFDNGYWSMYSIGDLISSPFYHKLHIAQLNVMYDLTRIESFKLYSEKFYAYQKSSWKRKRAFVVKVVQKLFGR